MSYIVPDNENMNVFRGKEFLGGFCKVDAGARLDQKNIFNDCQTLYLK